MTHTIRIDTSKTEQKVTTGIESTEQLEMDPVMATLLSVSLN